VAVATADKPEGPYADHGPLVCQPVGSIDGFSIRDENDKRYLVWKEDANSVGMVTPIWAQELSDDGKTLLGQPVLLFQNDPSWEANLVEGPYILVHKDTFYAFYSAAACCGKSCSYALGVARSKALLGPWEKNPNNPILVGNDAWKCPGHGSIVTDDEGKYYLLYHAYSGQDTVYVGRQGMLDEVVFGADGWPTINDGKGPSVSAPVPIAPQAPQPKEIFEDFSSANLAPGWQWPVANKPAFSIDTSNGGRLVLPAAPEGPGIHAGATIARSTLLGDYVAETEVSADPTVRAGLAAVGDGDNALGISVLANKVMVWRLGNGMSQLVAEGAAPIKTQLRMTAAKGHVYSFATSGDSGVTWEPIGSYVDSQAVDPDLPPWDRGVRVGLVASGPAGATAKFEFLRVTLAAP
jgi:beta-xylosidase